MEDLTSLIERVRAGKREAYGDLVRRFQDMAVGYSYALLGDQHLAEDAAQEAFVFAYLELEKLQEPASSSTHSADACGVGEGRRRWNWMPSARLLQVRGTQRRNSRPVSPETSSSVPWICCRNETARSSRSSRRVSKSVFAAKPVPHPPLPGGANGGAYHL